MGSTQAAQAEMSVSATSINTASSAVEFLTTNLQEAASIIDTNQIRGTRSHVTSQTRKGTSVVGGSIVVNPSPNDIDLWMFRAMGDQTGNSITLTETVPSFFVGYNPLATNAANSAFEFQTCKVNRSILRGSPGDPLELELDILATTAAALTYPTLSTPLGVTTADQPYVFSDLVWTFAGSARPLLAFELIIDNFLDARFANSNNATDITAQDRLVTFNVTSTFTSTELAALYNLAQAGTGSSTLVATHGGAANSMTMSIAFGTLQAPNLTPTIGSKSEIPLTISFVSRATNANDELVITNDSTD